MLLFSPVASALGLGEIEMQSALNQRLDAEIPLRGVPADDSSRIIVSLASEEAFRQVGLQRPFSLTRLSFAVKQRDSGGYYIHVTSREPIVEPFLSFLIEVDWPEGNLLREYTVLLDPPVFVSDEPEEEPAPAAEADAPAAAAEDESMAAGVPADIERDVEPEAAAEPEPEPEITAEAEAPATEADEAMAEETRRAEGDFSDTPVFLQVEQAEERAEAEARAMAEAEAEEISEAEPTTAAYDAAGDEYGPVQRGEALWNIASRLKRDDMTVQQMMLALLRYNPEAFVDDNINRMRQGYVLRIPDAEAVLSLSAQQAVARVREQNALWQEYRRALRGGTGPAQQQASADGAASTTVAGEDADLKIVGSEEGTGAGSDQDASATAGGGQASEQLQLAQEQLESARMEKAELESRVGELEETVGKMERLIELREDELARLQDQLRRIEDGADPAEVLADADDAAAESAEAADTEETTAAGDDMTAGETGEQAAEAADETETAAAGEEAETDADAAAADAGEELAEADTGETAESDETAAADADEEEAVGQADDETAQAAPATDGNGGGVTTVRTQPSEPGILDQVSGIVGSIGGTISGLVAGLGLGGIIPEPFVLPAVGAIVVLLLLGAMLAVRRSRAGLGEEADEEVMVDADAEAMFAAGGDDASEDFSALFDEDDTATADDTGLTDSLEAEASELAGGDVDAGDAEAELMSESFDLEGLEDTDETMTAGTESADDDTIAEADVYLAYGLHQQAEDLLNLAIEEQPERVDYRAKLLEAIYGGGRSEDFVVQARALRERVDDTANDPNWLRVVAMGQELAPSEELFQQEVDESLKPTGAGTAQPPETDLDIGGDDDSTDLDFSFDDEEGGDEGIDEKDDDTFAQTMMVDGDSLESHEGDAGLAEPESGATEDSDDEMDFDLSDFDLGDQDEGDSAGDATPAAEAPADDEESADFDLSDFDLGDEDEGGSAGDATPAAEVPTDDEESADFDLSDFDLGDEDEAGTPDTGAEEPAGETAGEEDALADFDLGDLEDAGESDEGAEEAVELGGDSDDFDFDLSEEDADESPAGEADTEPDAGEIDLGDIELEEASDSSAEGESAAGEDEDAFDFDLGEEAGETDDESAGADLDLGEDADLADMDLGDLEDSSDAGAGEEEDTGEAISLEDANEDVSLDDLAEDLAADDSGLVGPDTGEDEAAAEAADDSGPAAGSGDAVGDEDEYRTMLDLARAYIDMGDAESARSALEEVAESGSAEQRSEAQGLLDSI